MSLVVYLVRKVFASRTHIIGCYVGTLCIPKEHHRYIHRVYGIRVTKAPIMTAAILPRTQSHN